LSIAVQRFRLASNAEGVSGVSSSPACWRDDKTSRRRQGVPRRPLPAVRSAPWSHRAIDRLNLRPGADHFAIVDDAAVCPQLYPAHRRPADALAPSPLGELTNRFLSTSRTLGSKSPRRWSRCRRTRPTRSPARAAATTWRRGRSATRSGSGAYRRTQARGSVDPRLEGRVRMVERLTVETRRFGDRWNPVDRGGVPPCSGCYPRRGKGWRFPTTTSASRWPAAKNS